MAEENIRLLLVQWNMGNAAPLQINELLPTRFYEYSIIAFGLQESTYSVGPGINRAAPSQLEDALIPSYAHLVERMNTVLGSAYKILQHAKRAEMQLIIYCKNELINLASHIECSIENTGFLHVLPNKGGLCVSFHLGLTTFVIISTHLNAHEGYHHCQRRNDSVEEILTNVRIGNTKLDPSVQFHHVLWMGDMNYRLTFDPRLPTGRSQSREHSPEAASNTYNAKSHAEQLEDILKLVDTQSWDKLLELDELGREMKAGRLLCDFTALKPQFPPTFKRTRGLSIRGVSTKVLQKQSFSTNKAFEHRMITAAARSRSTSEVPPMNPDEIYRVDSDEYQGEDEIVIDLPSRTINRGESVWLDNASIATYYKPTRIPSYCDRILYKSLPGFRRSLRPLFFESCEKVLTSDHKPIRAGFEVKIRRSYAPVAEVSVNAEIIHLSAKNLMPLSSDFLGMGSGVDPFITVTADPMSILATQENVDIKSKTILSNLNPIWTEAIHFHIRSVDTAGVAGNAHLFLSVWDGFNASGPVLIGTLAIPLVDIIDSYLSRKTHYAFDDYLYKTGLRQGSLQGEIHLTPIKPEVVGKTSHSGADSDECCVLS